MTCSVEGCDNKKKARGLCNKHWYRWRQHGDPLAGKTPVGEPQRFYEEVVLKYEGDECLIWPYGNASGRGMMRRGDGMVFVARVLCTDIHGEPPADKDFAAHSCGNGHIGCVTKKHLSWKSPAENQADRIEHGTHNRGERHPLSKLTEQQVREILSLKGKETQAAIGERYGVTRVTVADIHNGRRWAWINREREFEPAHRRRQYSAVAVGASL